MYEVMHGTTVLFLYKIYTVHYAYPLMFSVLNKQAAQVVVPEDKK
jgi:hypothetical protein